MQKGHDHRLPLAAAAGRGHMVRNHEGVNARRISLRSRGAAERPSFETPSIFLVTTGLDPVVQADVQRRKLSDAKNELSLPLGWPGQAPAMTNKRTDRRERKREAERR
jgi:hypothetical protein